MIVFMSTGATISMKADAATGGALRPQQARIDLRLALGAGLSGRALAAVFDN
jgi:L-asparaginase/Glu-tRNA(Gln) amidotransferase subunit D